MCFGQSSYSSIGTKFNILVDLVGWNYRNSSRIDVGIVTFRHYDAKTDRHHLRLYVIPEELDFERELGKMITLESMRG